MKGKYKRASGDMKIQNGIKGSIRESGRPAE